MGSLTTTTNRLLIIDDETSMGTLIARVATQCGFETIHAANGKLAVVGFCWGGGKSFAFAAHRPGLTADFVFYGPQPPDITTITAPVYGFYAGNDARISSAVPDTIKAMKAAHKKYEPVIYDGAGHGFMRAGEAPDPSPANKKAREEGFARLIAELKKM